MGALGGALKPFSAATLAAPLLRRLLEGRDPAMAELILGHAIPAGCGPEPAREAALKAGLPNLPAFTVNQGAASGLRAVIQAVQALSAGAGGSILAGGMESSSSAPYLLPSARWGTRMGAAPVLDALLQDGPEPPPAPGPAEQDWIDQSQARHHAARTAGRFSAELAPLALQGPRGPVWLAEDEPVPAGGLTHGDGAAVLLLAAQASPSPLAQVLATAQGSDSAQAIQRLLAASGLALEDIDRFELDESRPAQLLQLLAQLPSLARARVNVLGGQLAMAHPLGAAGARLVVSLAHQLQEADLRYGLVAMEAHGSALALLLESR